MAGSNWNTYIERMLAADLNVAEHRLALGLARLILGFGRKSNRLGEAYLREVTGLDGRTFTRARAGLITKGLVTVKPGGRGRGKRALWTLKFDPTETPAPERAIRPQEKPAAERVIPPPRKNPLSVQERPAPERVRIGNCKGKNSEQSSPSNSLHRRAFETYLSAGGTLELDKERGALGRSVKSATAAGHTETEILAAIADLGRKHEFAGLLKQRITELREQGGACNWAGLDRSQLTLEQLETCTCNLCTEWATANEKCCQQTEAYYRENGWAEFKDESK